MGNKIDCLKLDSKLRRLADIVRSWSVSGAEEIERDRALEELREIYSEIKLGDINCLSELQPEHSSRPVEPKAEPESIEVDETPLPVGKKAQRSAILSLYDEDQAVAPANAPAETSSSEVYLHNGPEPFDLSEYSLPSSDEVVTHAYDNFTGSEGLRSSIGVNDRLVMVNDLFAGDANRFELALEELERFTDLNDALIYIHETYDWNPDSEGTKLLTEQLVKKLG